LDLTGIQTLQWKSAEEISVAGTMVWNCRIRAAAKEIPAAEWMDGATT